MSDRLLEQQDFFETTLSQNIDNDDTKIYLNILPSKTEGYLVISQDDASKREIVYFTSLGTSYINCPATGGRGIGGTSAQSHDSGESATLDGVAEYHNPIIKALANYRNRAELSFSGSTDNITVAIGTVVVNSSVCINATSVTLADIGVSGTNKSGNVSSGGIRYIYAQDNEDNTFTLYVSNNTSEVGKRRLGFAKFNEGSTSVIRYVYNDDENSPFARGMVVEWTGPTTDVPQGWEYDTASAGRFTICANLTYTIGLTGGQATYDFSHVHTISTVSTEHTHTIAHTHTLSHTHTYSGTIRGSNADRKIDDGGDHYVCKDDHQHTYSGATSDANNATTSNSSVSNSGSMSANASHTHTPGSSLSSAQSIMPPFIARTKIVKL
jgi:hypothetical protein